MTHSTQCPGNLAEYLERTTPGNNGTGPSPNSYPNRDRYLVESKPIYLRLKTLNRKKLAIASNIKTLENKLQKVFSTAVNFRFNVNSMRNPKLKEAWNRASSNCNRQMTLAPIDDLQVKYNKI